MADSFLPFESLIKVTANELEIIKIMKYCENTQKQ